MSVPNKTIAQKQVSLPFAKAFEFAVKSIRVRFWRSMITAGGVFLGIAFLSSVLVSKNIAGPNAPLEEIARTNWLAALSLLVCAVGITNSMLMSVTERFREIGTMKCLGALEKFIVMIFMIEAALTGFIASVFGWIVGTVLMIVTKYFLFNPKLDPNKTWNGDLSWTNVGQSFAFCLVIGIVLTALSTLFPALRASSIPPAAALRSDN
jgi:putative ABC transport system permease protein